MSAVTAFAQTGEHTAPLTWLTTTPLQAALAAVITLYPQPLSDEHWLWSQNLPDGFLAPL